MGYIFDALQRAGDADEPPRRPDQRETPATRDVLHTAGTLDTGRPPSEEATSFHIGDAAFDPDHVPSTAIDPKKVDERLVAITKPANVMSEEYRAIRTSILARWEQRRNLVHLITSATPQEGKTITSLNLGLIFAELRNRRTLVIEADLRLPQFSKLLNTESPKGLISVLKGEAPLSESIERLEDHNLHVLAAGGRAGKEAVQLLAGARMADLLKQLRRQYDHIVIDTPPVVDLADAGILGGQSDDVFLIVRLNRTIRPLVEQAIRTLQSYNAPVAGMIATDQQRHNRKYYYYRYGYRYHYRYAYSEAA